MRRIRPVWMAVAAVGFVCSGLGLDVRRGQDAAAQATSPDANDPALRAPRSAEYKQVQKRLAQGWNTWDVHSVTTHVLLPEGLAIQVGMMHNTTEGGDAFLQNVLIGRQSHGAEQVFPRAHSWDGGYSDLRVDWNGHNWRIQSAHDGEGLVLLASPLPSKPVSALPPTIVFAVNFLWNRPGVTLKHGNLIEARGSFGIVPVYCTCPNAEDEGRNDGQIPLSGAYFAVDFVSPVGLSTGKRRDLTEIQAAIERQKDAYQKSIAAAGKNAPLVDAIETALGWDTIYDPEKKRVISPVSRVWSVGWGGYVLFDWDTFFAA
ncbi:MAG: hypothetical protein ABSE57_34070, partial [Bryobacteraceae bacterium]